MAVNERSIEGFHDSRGRPLERFGMLSNSDHDKHTYTLTYYALLANFGSSQRTLQAQAVSEMVEEGRTTP